MWGKVKTVCQMAMTIMLLIHLDAAWFRLLETILIEASVALTLISLATYIYQNKQVLAGDM